MAQLTTRRKPKDRKISQPRPGAAQLAGAAINDVPARAGDFQISIRDLIELALRSEPEPNIDLPTLFKRHLLKNPRFFLWAMEHVFGKPGQHLDTTGAAGAPMQIKLVIETIGGEE